MLALIFGIVGWIVGFIGIFLWYLSGEGRKIAKAKLTGKVLLEVYDTDSHRVYYEPIPVKELLFDKGGRPRFLGNWQNYFISGVKVFPVVKDTITDFDPEVMLEVNKAYQGGASTFKDLLDMMLREEEVEQETPDGQKVKVRVRRFTPLAFKTHRVVKVSFKSNKRGPAYLHLEEYSPIDVVKLDEFYNRKFSGDVVKKIIREMETVCQERIQRAVADTIKRFAKVNTGVRTSTGMKAVYWIYIATAVAIVIIAFKAFMG